MVLGTRKASAPIPMSPRRPIQRIATFLRLKWGPAPPAFPKGAEIAVIAGAPGKEGPFVFRISLTQKFLGCCNRESVKWSRFRLKLGGLHESRDTGGQWIAVCGLCRGADDPGRVGNLDGAYLVAV